MTDKSDGGQGRGSRHSFAVDLAHDFGGAILFSFPLLMTMEIAIAIHYMHYNFVRVHKTLRCTPAMAAGVTSRLWEISEIVALLDDPKYARRDED